MRKINNEALQEILTIPQEEFIKKYNISYRTYIRWKNKVLQNNNQNQNNDIQNNQSQNNDEMEKGKIEQIPSLENKAILDLDGDNENNNQVANNSPDLVKSFCEVVYKGGVFIVPMRD
ncbi:MAG: hypothetical protein N2504_07620 [candidate division WOR-3 bacterium]|nr:hypothetical protein [candidate division WOR-3 bacterium]